MGEPRAWLDPLGVHLDGYNQLPYLTGGSSESAQIGFFSTEGIICMPFAAGTGRSISKSGSTGLIHSISIWRPHAYPLRAGEKSWTIMRAAYILKLHAETFMHFPPRQAAPDFDSSAMLKHAVNAATNGS